MKVFTYLFFQQIPENTCDLIETNPRSWGKALCHWPGKAWDALWGRLIFICGRVKTSINSSIIETFVRQGVCCITPEAHEDALKASELRYRGIVEDQTEFVTGSSRNVYSRMQMIP